MLTTIGIILKKYRIRIFDPLADTLRPRQLLNSTNKLTRCLCLGLSGSCLSSKVKCLIVKPESFEWIRTALPKQIRILLVPKLGAASFLP